MNDVGSLKGTSRELVKALKDHNICVACIQETRWKEGEHMR